jgi:hypothetical protein
MKSYNSFIKEAKNEKVAVVTFGRLNPPSIGHSKLIDVMLGVAKRNSGTPMVFLSHTQNSKKDPLDYRTKVKICQKAFGRNIVKNDTVNNPFDVVYKLRDEGYTHVYFVAGSDRVPQYTTMFKKYSGHPDKDKDIGVKLQVVSGGDRDPDADNAEGMSAGKMRTFAMENDYEHFVLASPDKLSVPDVKKLFIAVRKAMGAK